MKWIFFGTPVYAVETLTALKDHGYLPSLIVTAPNDQYRNTPPPVQQWADIHGIPTIQPHSLKEVVLPEADVFIVAAYGKIIPKQLLAIPRYGVLNVHPSLLPKYRGPSPLEAPYLHNDSVTGVTIMCIDEYVDHGPILTQETVALTPEKEPLARTLFYRGGVLLATLLPEWISGTLTPTPQNHTEATITKKITKADGHVSLNDDPQVLWNKFRAYTPWPGIFIMVPYNGKTIRVRIVKATFSNGVFTPEVVLPEGKKQMTYLDFLRGKKE